MPKISVIIPTYNTAKYIGEAIDSVLRQTYKDYEIIIIDDGSSDGTRQLLDQWGHKIRYIYQDNKGLSSARNRGIREAWGKYVAFLDADDTWLPDKLMRQVTLAEQNPEAALVFSDAEVFNDSGILRPSSRSMRYNQNELESLRYKIAVAIFNDGSIFKGDFYKDLALGNLITVSTVIVRKACLKKIGCFDEGLSAAEDYDLWLRIAQDHSLLYFNGVTARYRSRDDSMSGKENLRSIFYKMHDARVLEKQLFDCPSDCKDLIKKRILGSYKTAIWGHYNMMDFKKVRRSCLLSLRHDKFQMKLYLYLLATFFPPGFIKSRTSLGF